MEAQWVLTSQAVLETLVRQFLQRKSFFPSPPVLSYRSGVSAEFSPAVQLWRRILKAFASIITATAVSAVR